MKNIYYKKFKNFQIAQNNKGFIQVKILFKVLKTKNISKIISFDETNISNYSSNNYKRNFVYKEKVVFKRKIKFIKT